MELLVNNKGFSKMKIIIGKCASGKTKYIISQLDDAEHVYIYTKKPSDYNSLKNVNTITEFCEFKKLLDIYGSSFVFVVDELLTINIKDINEILFNPHIYKKIDFILSQEFPKNSIFSTDVVNGLNSKNNKYFMLDLKKYSDEDIEMFALGEKKIHSLRHQLLVKKEQIKKEQKELLSMEKYIEKLTKRTNTLNNEMYRN